MGFLGLSKPKWKHADAQVRLAAIATITEDRQGLLADIAKGDADARVRLAAAHRVTDQSHLEHLLGSSDAEVVRVARERLSGVAVKLVRERPLASCRAILGAIADQKSLAELSVGATDPAVRVAAFDRLAGLPEPSPAMLELIAVQDAAGDLGLRAVALLAQRGALKDVARKAKAERVRVAAQARIEAIGSEVAKPSAERTRKQRLRDLEPLAANAQRLALVSDWARAEREWLALESARDQALASHAAVTVDEAAGVLVERIARARREFNQRRAEHEARLAGARATREAFLVELEARPAAEPGAGSALRADLAARWAALVELPVTERAGFDARFAAHLERICAGDPAIHATTTAASGTGTPVVLPDAQREELEKLVTEAESLVGAADWREARERYRHLHKRWHQLVAPLAQDHVLRRRFVDAYEASKDRQRANREEREKATVERLKQLEILAAEAESLAAAPPSEAEQRMRFDRLRDLQAAWKAVGPVRPDRVDKVRGRFRAALDQAYVPLKALQEAEDWERFAHLAKAEEMIAGVEALAVIEDLAVVAGQVKQLQARWRDLGPLPRDRRESSWQRFKAACDVAYERLKPYFAELDAQRLVNLERKRALLTEAEALANAGPIGLAGSPADLAAKRTGAERMKWLQQEWRTVGPVPREHDQDLWTRFRAAADTFFGKHRADIDARHQEYVQNLNQKFALCVVAETQAQDAEAAAAGGEAKIKAPADRLREIKDVQAKWKLIGHVPRDQVEAVWSRFRTACDRVYATLKDHLDEQERARQENLAKKQALITEAEEILAHENPRWFKDELKELQRRWREIGHVPREQMDVVGGRFKELCDRIYAL